MAILSGTLDTTMCLLRLHERFDIINTLELYSQELSLDFQTSRFNDTIFITAEDGSGRDPDIWVEFPAGTDIDGVVDALYILLRKINAQYDTSLTKLKMKRELRGETS